MRHVPDLARLGRKLQKRTKAGLMDAWRLYQFVQQLPGLRQALEEADEASEGGLFKERLIEPLAQLEQDFKTVCDGLAHVCGQSRTGLCMWCNAGCACILMLSIRLRVEV